MGASMASAHLTIVNLGDEPDELVAASSPDCEDVRLHVPRSVPSVGQDQVAAPRVQVAPHSLLTVGSHSVKLLLIDPVQPLHPGAELAVTLRFRRSGQVTIVLPMPAAKRQAQITED